MIKSDAIEAYNNYRDSAVRNVIYNKDYYRMKQLMRGNPNCGFFFRNPEDVQIDIMDRMARKMVCNIKTFTKDEKKAARKWLKEHGSSEDIGI